MLCNLTTNGDHQVQPENCAGKQYHICCSRGDLEETLLVPGDPDRITKIASSWDSSTEIASNREFRSVTGVYRGVRISALSSGIGPASMAIVVNEASSIGVKNFIRVGSTGSLQPNIACGDVVISTAAVRLDATSSCYVVPEYPATAHYEVLLALIEAAEHLGICNYHIGVTATTNDFYAGQNQPIRRGVPISDNLVPSLQKAGVLNVEMETATLFTLASLFGLRAGAVLAVYNSHVTGEFKPHAGEDNAVKIADEAVRILCAWDAVKAKTGKKYLYPSMLK
jgi:uridine phosphorylase